jgi:hypothetical protein
MNQPRWSAVDAYLEDLLVPADSARRILEIESGRALKASASADAGRPLAIRPAFVGLVRRQRG